MAGIFVGQVKRAGRALHAAGLSRTAVWALGVVVAEECRAETRLGVISLAAIATATISSERTASRVLAELRTLGLITLVQRGGGRGRAGMPAVYRLVDLDQWLAGRGVTVAAQSAPAPAEADPDGGSIAPEQAQGPAGGGSITDPAATSGAPITASGRHDSDPPAIPGRSTRHPGGDLSVVPGKDLLREGHEVASGPDRVATTPPPAASIDPPAAAAAAPVPAGSLCGTPGCRSPLPCGACGRARKAAKQAQAAAAAELAALVEAERLAEIEVRRAAAAERRAAAASCPHRCTGGYLGRSVCDHQPRPDHTQLAGYQLLRQVLGQLALPAGRPSRSPARTGRHATAA